MEKLTSSQPVPSYLHGAVVALGNFDGFHRGHQTVVGRARAVAQAKGVPLIVATFSPHPVRYFQPATPPFQLTTLDQRFALFEAAGADAMLVIEFGAEIAGMTAEAFVTDFLIGHIRASHVVTGEDFTFGKARGGNAQRLREIGAPLGLQAEAVSPVADGEGVVSSSRIRDALEAGDCTLAADLLTRPFTIRGTVQHGDKLGRTIGYPTANVAIGDYLRPAYGVYAVRARLADGRVFDGAANIGIRPQFDPPKELLEPYLFDFSGDLYGQEIDVEMLHFLRPEAKFDSLEALVAQIDADCAQARHLLAV